MRTKLVCVCGLLVVCCFVADWAPAASPPPGSVSKVIDSGPDGEKLNIAVLGDGYAAGDQATFDRDVEQLLLRGVFGRDFFRQYQSAFNVYRVRLVSKESGVSQKKYDERGTPYDDSDDTVISSTSRDTALKFIWSGSWAHCWLEPSEQTEELLKAALNKYVPTYTYVLVILNQNTYGGCGGGGRQYVLRGATWDVVAHEYGHGIGGLWDEYFNPGTVYGGSPFNSANISTILNRDTVAWHDLIRPETPVPTDRTPGIDPNKTVGEFEGAATVEKGVYRPVNNCRMRSNTPPFCPVCERILLGLVGPHLAPRTPTGPALPTVATLGVTRSPRITPIDLRENVKWTADALNGPAAIAASAGGAGLGSNDRPAAPAAAKPAKPGKYLQMVLQIDQTGQATVVSAIEVPGHAIVSNAGVGDYVYELTVKDDRPILVHALPNPFEGRTFPSPPTPQDPQGKPEGHHEVTGKKATIVVRVPNITLEEAIADDLAVKVYKVKPGPKVVRTLDPQTMKMLRTNRQLEWKSGIPANKLGPELRQVGRKLDAR